LIFDAAYALMSLSLSKYKQVKTMKRLKNKKTLAIAGGILGVAAIGGVIAYNQDLISFANIFGLDSYETVFTEVFDAPTNWQPCEEVTKTFTVTNNNSYPVAVRFKLNEYWRTSNTSYPSTNHEDSDLSLTFNKGGTQSPIAVINPSSNASDWELGSDGWYYLKNDLAAGATSSSYLQSVTMDCDFNMVGSVTYSQDGKTGESQPNDYANSTYHIFIAGQTIPSEHKSDWRPAPHTADCDDPNNDLLYDKIACATNGNDTGISYNTTESSTSATGFGVNTLASTASDQFPTYYFRGNVTDNNVLWSDQCWKIIRTTSTGGVKMIWMGEATNGQCQSTTASGGINASDKSFNSSFDGLTRAGYTYGTIYAMADQYIDKNATLNWANDVSWNGTSYTLVDYINGSYVNNQSDVVDDHHYTCLDGGTSCSSVAYVWRLDETDTSAWPMYISMSNGVTVETVLDDAYADTNDSVAKTQVDSWYNTTIPAARRTDLEDTVFCNDRSVGWGSLIGKDEAIATYMVRPFDTSYSTYVNSGRIRDDNDTLSLSCNSRDSYTVSSGKLTYPVGLMSVDEVRLSGKSTSSNTFGVYDYLNDYGNNSVSTWTMTPAGIDIEGEMEMYTVGDYATYAQGQVGFSPVVSLKFGAKYSGTGTASDPYTISF
jgi:alternate signal-mediated exported protein